MFSIQQLRKENTGFRRIEGISEEKKREDFRVKFPFPFVPMGGGSKSRTKKKSKSKKKLSLFLYIYLSITSYLFQFS